jgi:hypothetical protein
MTGVILDQVPRRDKNADYKREAIKRKEIKLESLETIRFWQV